MRRAADLAQLVLAQLVDNARGLVFISGCVLGYVGVAGYSTPAANIAAGLVLMLIGAWPYLVFTVAKARKG